jgi:hypothetical protein
MPEEPADQNPSSLPVRINYVKALQCLIRLVQRRRSYPTGEPAQEAFCRTLLRGNFDSRGEFKTWKSLLMRKDQGLTISLQSYEDIYKLEGTGLSWDLKAPWLFNGIFEDEEFRCLTDTPEFMILVTTYAYHIRTAEFHEEVCDSLGGDVLFISSKGYMGIGLRPIQDGDVIVAVSTLLYPMILRRDGDYYKLVGPAQGSQQIKQIKYGAKFELN